MPRSGLMMTAAPPWRHMARMILLAAAAAAAALLAAAPAEAATQQPTLGATCGPNDDGEWIKPNKLAASGGGTVGSDGCITAGGGAKTLTPFVRADLLPTTYTLFEVYMASSSSSSKRNVSVRFGDVDLVKWPKVAKTKLFKNEGECASLPLGGEQHFACSFSWAGAGNTGMYFSVIGEGAKVCGLMLCVKEKLFSETGEALSPKAARLYDTVVADRQAAGGKPAGAAALIGPAAAGTCAGYSTQDYKACSDGNDCVSTYKPGDDHCSCWHCSAFTDVRQCNQGDTSIGQYSCCYSCPPQKICAVCQPKCVDQVTSVQVIPGQMPTSPSSYTPGTGKISSTTIAQNFGANAQTVQVTFSFTQQITSSMTWGNKNTFTEKASASIGLPFIGETGLEFTAAQEMSEDKTASTSRTVTVTYQLTQQIPPFTAQVVNATADLGIVEVKIPVTIQTTSTCSGVKSDANTITVKADGVMDATTSKLSITYGAQIPLDPPVVLDQADATCSSNPACRALSLTTGNCCPDDNGDYNSCCSFCAAKTACSSFAADATTMCCPSRSNQYNPCCNA